MMEELLVAQEDDDNEMVPASMDAAAVAPEVVCLGEKEADAAVTETEADPATLADDATVTTLSKQQLKNLRNRERRKKRKAEHLHGHSEQQEQNDAE